MARMTLAALTASSVALIAAGPALAQQNQETQQNQTDQAQGQQGVDVLTGWAYGPLYQDGWSVEEMFFETEVIGPGGEDIGDVENVIFSNDGEVLGIIAQVGGFWDIGDTHVNIPWDEVTMSAGIEQIVVPVTEENVEDYDVFGDYWGDEQIIDESDVDETQVVDDDLYAGEGIFKATDLVGDYVFLSDNARYGYISDVIVRDGQIDAVVTDARTYGLGGYYAYPYDRTAMTAGSRYQMPYDAATIDTIENFDYEQLQTSMTQ